MTAPVAPQQGDLRICPSTGDAPAVVIRVGLVERDDVMGEIVHLSIRPRHGRDVRILPHAPFALAALENCADASNELFSDIDAEFAKGYDTWREAFDAGSAGVFTIPPGEAWLAIMQIADTAKKDDG